MGTARLQTPSNDSRDIIAMAVRALENIWQEGRRYLKGGVVLGISAPPPWRRSICSTTARRAATASG